MRKILLKVNEGQFHISLFTDLGHYITVDTINKDKVTGTLQCSIGERKVPGHPPSPEWDSSGRTGVL